MVFGPRNRWWPVGVIPDPEPHTLLLFEELVTNSTFGKCLKDRIPPRKREIICKIISKGLSPPSFYLCYFTPAAAAAKSRQSCPTLCDPIDGSPPGSAIPGILQARTLEWVAIFFSSAWRWKMKVKSLSRVRLFTTPWTAAHQAPLSMGFSRQEHWSGVPLPSPIFPQEQVQSVLQWILSATAGH